MPTDPRFDRLEGKVDGLQDRLIENHLEVLEKIEKLNNDTVSKVHAVEVTVNKHEQHFSTLNKLFLSGGIIGIWAIIKDFLPHK